MYKETLRFLQKMETLLHNSVTNVAKWAQIKEINNFESENKIETWNWKLEVKVWERIWKW
jgi:hypothetical protein